MAIAAAVLFGTKDLVVEDASGAELAELQQELQELRLQQEQPAAAAPVHGRAPPLPEIPPRLQPRGKRGPAPPLPETPPRLQPRGPPPPLPKIPPHLRGDKFRPRRGSPPLQEVTSAAPEAASARTGSRRETEQIPPRPPRRVDSFVGTGFNRLSPFKQDQIYDAIRAAQNKGATEEELKRIGANFGEDDFAGPRQRIDSLTGDWRDAYPTELDDQ